MHENGRMLGLGLAAVDYKVKPDNTLVLPNSRDALPDFLQKEIIEKNRPHIIRAGGSIANILSTFASLASNQDFKLFYAIGNDSRGLFYVENTTPRLGAAQVHIGGETGFWIGIMNEEGGSNGLSYHGVGDRQTTVPHKVDTQEHIALFMTDITSCKDSSSFCELESVLKTVKQDGGNFALGLGGARPNSINQEAVAKMLSSFLFPPDIIFGNEAEFLYASGASDLATGLGQSFPDTRLIVVTLDSRGSIIRFEGKTLFVPAVKIAKTSIIDKVGAGDAYIGTMLAYLYERPYSKWNALHIAKAVSPAGQAGALIIQTMESRLTPILAETIKRNFFGKQNL